MKLRPTWTSRAFLVLLVLVLLCVAGGVDGRGMLHRATPYLQPSETVELLDSSKVIHLPAIPTKQDERKDNIMDALASAVVLVGVKIPIIIKRMTDSFHRFDTLLSGFVPPDKFQQTVRSMAPDVKGVTSDMAIELSNIYDVNKEQSCNYIKFLADLGGLIATDRVKDAVAAGTIKDLQPLESAEAVVARLSGD